MLIPEVVIYNSIKALIELINDDYEEKSADNEECTILYKAFHTDDNGNRIKYSRYDWYDQAKALIIRDNENPKQLDVTIGYNLERAKTPNVHILLPSQNKGKFDSLGKDEYQEEDACGNNIVYTKEFTQNVVYHLMITSPNVHEVLITFYLLQYMFIAYIEHFEHLGLQDLSFSGQDVNIQQDLTPAHIFHRNLSVAFDYGSNVSIVSKETAVSGVEFNICSDLAQKYKDFMNQ